MFGIGQAYGDIYSHPTKPENISLPKFQSVTCQFSQTKTIPNSTSQIQSGGNFKFIKEKGVIFETKFPLQMTTSYTSDENRRISSIISAIDKKDYAYLNQNFDLFYERTNQQWTLALRPKASSKINPHISSIVIQGNSYINKLDINTRKNGSTKINFTNCK